MNYKLYFGTSQNHKLTYIQQLHVHISLKMFTIFRAFPGQRDRFLRSRKLTCEFGYIASGSSI